MEHVPILAGGASESTRTGSGDGQVTTPILAGGLHANIA
jgi:hypothetical protein